MNALPLPSSIFFLPMIDRAVCVTGTLARSPLIPRLLPLIDAPLSEAARLYTYSLSKCKNRGIKGRGQQFARVGRSNDTQVGRKDRRQLSWVGWLLPGGLRSAAQQAQHPVATSCLLAAAHLLAAWAEPWLRWAGQSPSLPSCWCAGCAAARLLAGPCRRWPLRSPSRPSWSCAACAAVPVGQRDCWPRTHAPAQEQLHTLPMMRC